MCFAHIDSVKVGTRLKADAGFTCIKAGRVLTVKEDEYGLFIQCRDGQHYINGQLDDDSLFVGLTLVEAD